jgi:hypothetical protein
MPLSTHRTTQTQNKRTQTSMPWVGFEPTIPVFKRENTVHVLDRTSTLIGEGVIFPFILVVGLQIPLIILISLSEVRLNPLDTSTTNRPIVPAPDDRRVWSIPWNENWQGKPKYSEKPCPSATVSIINPTCLDLGSTVGCRGGKPVTNPLSYDTARSSFKSPTFRPVFSPTSHL